MIELTINEIKTVQIEILNYIDNICRENDIKYSLADGTLLGAVRHKGFIPWDDDIDILLTRTEYNRLLDLLYKENDDNYRILSLKDNGYFYPYAKVSDKRTVINEKNWPFYESLGVNIDIFPIDYIPENYEREYYDNSMIYVNGLYNCLTDIAYAHNQRYMRLIKKFLRYRKVKKCREKGEWYWKDRISSMTQIKKSRKMARIVEGEFIVWEEKMFEEYTEIEFENKKYSVVKDYEEMLEMTYGDYMQLPPEDERVSNHDFVAYWK